MCNACGKNIEFVDDGFEEKIELFIDESYYDMWAVKIISNGNFEDVFHFSGEKEARRLKETLERYMKLEENFRTLCKALEIENIEDLMNSNTSDSCFYVGKAIAIAAKKGTRGKDWSEEF